MINILVRLRAGTTFFFTLAHDYNTEKLNKLDGY